MLLLSRHHLPPPFSYSNDNNRYLSFFPILLGLILDLLLVGAPKFLILRPRPIYNKDMILVVSVDHWSFPRGHSSMVFFVASFLYLAASYGKFLVSDAVVGRVFLWAAAKSISWVMLGRHFVGDVIAGTTLGVVEGVFVPRFFKIYIEAAFSAHPTADVFINFASYRSAAASSLSALKQPTIRLIAIIAEGVPESDTKQLIAYARANNKSFGKCVMQIVIGPAIIGGIYAGAFKIGDAAGTIDNIVQCIAIGGDVFPGSTLSDHILRFNNIPQVLMSVGFEIYRVVGAGV